MRIASDRFHRRVQNIPRDTDVPILDHRGDCVGDWEYVSTGEVIRCGRCLRQYPANPERRFVAEFDRILAGHMRELAADGAAILALERGK
jgi:hypothetical protein